MRKGSPRVLFIQYFVALHVEGQPPGSNFSTLWPYMWKGSPWVLFIQYFVALHEEGQPRVLFIQYFVALHVEGQPPGSIYSVLCGFT